MRAHCVRMHVYMYAPQLALLGVLRDGVHLLLGRHLHLGLGAASRLFF